MVESIIVHVTDSCNPLRILLEVEQSVWVCGRFGPWLSDFFKSPSRATKGNWGQRMKKKNQKSPLSTSQHPLRNPSLTLGFPSLCQQQIPATSHCQECFLQNLTIPTLPIQSQSIYSPTLSSPPAMSKHATLRTLLLSTGNSKVPIT